MPLCAGALLAACGPLHSATPVATGQGCAIDAPTLLADLHRARRSSTSEARSLDDGRIACLNALPALPDDLAERLDFVLAGDVSAMESLRIGLAAREGSLSVLASKLERAVREEVPATRRASWLLELSWVQRRRGLRDDAEKSLAQAAELDPGDPWIAAARLELAGDVGLDRRERRRIFEAHAPAIAPLDPARWRLAVSVSAPNGLARFAAHSAEVAALVAAAGRSPGADFHRLRLAEQLAERPERWDRALTWLSVPDPTPARLALARAQLEWRMGLVDQAVQRARALERSVPRWRPPLVSLEAWEKVLGQYASAEAHGSALTLLDRGAASAVSDDPVAWARLARRLAAGESAGDEAREMARHVVNLAPEQADAHIAQGQVEELLGDRGQASVAYRRAEALLLEEAESRPDLALRRVRLGTLRLERLDDPAGAAQAAREALAVERSAEALFLACRAAELRGDTAEAAPRCRDAAALAPAWTAPWLRLVVMARTTLPTDEENALRNVLIRDPERWPERLALSATLLARHLAPQCWTVLFEPLDWPGAPTWVVHNVAPLLEQRGLVGVAGLGRFLGVLPFAGQSVEAWRSVAAAHRRRGRWGSAGEATRTAVRLSGDLNPLVEHAEAAAEGGADEEARSALAALSRLPAVVSIDYARVARVARQVGLDGVAVWARCRMQRGEDADCGTNR